MAKRREQTNVIALTDKSTTMSTEDACRTLILSGGRSSETILTACDSLLQKIAANDKKDKVYMDLIYKGLRSVRDRVRVDIADNKRS